MDETEKKENLTGLQPGTFTDDRYNFMSLLLSKITFFFSLLENMVKPNSKLYNFVAAKIPNTKSKGKEENEITTTKTTTTRFMGHLFQYFGIKKRNVVHRNDEFNLN